MTACTIHLRTCCFVPPEINSLPFHQKVLKDIGFLPKSLSMETFVSEKGKYKYLGEFIDEVSARKAYLTAKLEMAKKLAEKIQRCCGFKSL